MQKLNQVLEDKLLQMVDKMKGEKSQLTKDIATLSVRLAESKHNYSMLQKENVGATLSSIICMCIYFRYILMFSLFMFFAGEIQE